MKNQELTYWTALALINRVYTRRKTELYLACAEREPDNPIITLFDNSGLWPELGLTEQETEIFSEVRSRLTNVSFMVEDLLNQGYRIIPFISPDYPPQMLKSLENRAPITLFAKGNIDLLRQPTTGIVGARNATEISLEFTARVARREVEQGRVIVSGGAKGVDNQALTSALEADGRSIIVLPQGITTYGSGYRENYRHFTRGNLLAISTFRPDAPWNSGLAMMRNGFIYALSERIFVAQSNDNGGTWEGANQGINVGYPVFVRQPQKGEDNANQALIDLGGTPVDMDGNAMESPSPHISPEQRIGKALETGPKSAADILKITQLGWTAPRLRKLLDTMPEIEQFQEKRKKLYRLRGNNSGQVGRLF